MSTRRVVLRSTITALALVAGGRAAALGQDGATTSKGATDAAKPARPEIALLSALRSHPVTAPYPITAAWRKGAVVLSGRVGTKEVHDVAVRIAIDMGVPFRDNLVIDTGTADLAAYSAALAAQAALSGAPALSSSSMFVYPPPLMGRVDDPFFGFLPPIVSFPPWWRRRVDSPAQVAPRPIAANAAAAAAAASTSLPNGAPRDGRQPLDDPPVKGQVEITVDSAGQVFLRGVVASEEAGREIVETARSVPGVTRVESDLQVVPRRADAEDVPPPPVPLLKTPVGARPNPPARERALPPTPDPAIVPARARVADPGPAALDSQALSSRVVGSLKRRPPAAELPVKVRSSSAGTVTLAGRVPSAYEAMVVYRATEQTPGVHQVIDRLEFVVPDEDHPNPLLQKGRPEDLEAYLASQIRRHVGDLAHIDRIHVRGDVLELRGSVMSDQHRDRLLAILRSIPVLHGFRLEPEFTAE
jgi:osmotically-inducible protein OsmY